MQNKFDNHPNYGLNAGSFSLVKITDLTGGKLFQPCLTAKIAFSERRWTNWERPILAALTEERLHPVCLCVLIPRIFYVTSTITPDNAMTNTYH